MKVTKAVLILLSLSAVNFFSCNNTVQNNSTNKITGYWYAELNNGDGKQEFVFVFKTIGNEISGKAHSYFNRIKYPPLKLFEIKYRPPKLTFIAKTSQRTKFEGTVDTVKNSINGVLYYENGTSRNIYLKKYDKNKITKMLPGISTKTLNYSYQEPEDDKDGITVGNSDDVGLPENIIAEMMNSIYNGDYGSLNSILIYKNNKLVVEEYLNEFSQNDLYPIQSCTKSIASLLIGIAHDKGMIGNLNKPVTEYLGDYRSKASKDWGKISILNILTMSSGLDWSDGYDEEINSKSSNIIADVLKRKIKTEPGLKFNYISPDVSVLAPIIKNATLMQADKFAEEFLFKPLGITNYKWDELKQNGYPLMSGTLALKPRDMLKIGILVLNKGKWHDKQIISEAWINEIEKIQIKTGEPFDYSYLWWIGKTRTFPAHNVVLADGLGSQFIVVVPDFKLVVVTTGSNFKFKEHLKALKMIDKFIIQNCR